MGEILPVDAISADSVLTVRSDVVSVELDGELVLYDDASKVLHRLNPSASVLWQCLDGEATLAEIAADTADVFREDPGRVLADVVAGARHLANQGLLIGVGEAPQPEPDGGDGSGEGSGPSGRPEVVPEDVAEGGSPFVHEAPAPCMDLSFRLGEEGSMTVRAGTRLLGLRVSTPELAEAARGVLGPALVAGVTAPSNVSVVQTRARSGRPLLYCYRSGQLVTRARSTRRALEAAVTLLSTYGAEYPSIPALVAVRGQTAALLCPESRTVASGLGPRLRAEGWELVDTAGAALDPETGEVVIPAPMVEVDRSRLDSFPRDRSDGSPAAPGHYPVVVWVAVAGDDPLPESAAARLATLAAGAEGLHAHSAAAILQATLTMLRGATWAVSPSLDAGAIVRTLTHAVA